MAKESLSLGAALATDGLHRTTRSSGKLRKLVVKVHLPPIQDRVITVCSTDRGPFSYFLDDWQAVDARRTELELWYLANWIQCWIGQ